MHMEPDSSPALRAFLEALGTGCDFCQVQVRPLPPSFELRHVTDRGRPSEELRPVRVTDLRVLAQTTESGAYRALKAAPNLVSGWCCVAGSGNELEVALGHLYPGALADWAAVRKVAAAVPVTHFREFMGRQTGIYRGVRHLDEAGAAAVIGATCHPRFCLKRRWWTVDGLAPDDPGATSELPCLEPCAVLLDGARQATRGV